jgi:hypothetical protein
MKESFYYGKILLQNNFLTMAMEEIWTLEEVLTTEEVLDHDESS